MTCEWQPVAGCCSMVGEGSSFACHLEVVIVEVVGNMIVCGVHSPPARPVVAGEEVEMIVVLSDLVNQIQQ